MKDSFVSVIIPTFNGNLDHTLLALDSIHKQSFSSFECLIIDDSTNKDYISFLQEYCNSHSKFFYYGRYSNGGLGSALNYGLSLSKGNLIARMDADDISNSERLEVQTRFLDNNPEVDIVGSNMEIIDSAGNHLGFKTYKISNQDIKKQFVFRSAMAHPTIMFRKFADSNLNYDPSFRMCEDLELWLRLIKNGFIFANINENLLLYRENVIYKRVREHWKYNLRARVKNFSFLNIGDYFSALIALAHFVVPNFIRAQIYDYMHK